MIPQTRAQRRASQSKRKHVKSPFARIVGHTFIGAAVSYRHPTKGLRFRRATPRLLLGLLSAA